MKRVAATLALAVMWAAAGCSAGPPTAPSPVEPQSSSGSPPAPAPSSSSPSTGAGCRSVVVAAGDIVSDVKTADRTGRLAAAQDPDRVLVLGDNQYPDGSLADYQAKYDQTAWGELKPITEPVPGNHEYRTKGADGYYTYYDHPAEYYAYDAGCGWRGYALNSEIDLGPQVSWLRRDLAAHADAPVLASWHRPRWSSGTEHGSDGDVQPLVSALSGRSGVILNGHEHNYERFAPRDGLREFVVGTGGTSTYGFGSPADGSERRLSRTPGVLRLELRPGGGYRWTFLDTSGGSRDAGEQEQAGG
jgi:acid phosphatase type 7